MVEPRRAAVRPRVKRDGEVVLLEEEVRTRLESCPRGFIVLGGSAGSGKSTALAHLAHVFACDARLSLVDGVNESDAEHWYRLSAVRLVICAMPPCAPSEMQVIPDTWWLAPWTNDDLIEYVLSAHRACSGRVLQRFQADPARLRLAGVPQLCRQVLDQFAADGDDLDIQTALRRSVEASLTSIDALAACRLWCFVVVRHPNPNYKEWLLGLDRCEGTTRQTCALARHEFVQQLLAADHIASELRSPDSTDVLVERLSPALVWEAATLVRHDPQVARRLMSILTASSRLQQPMAASLLHAMHGNWVPRGRRAPLLKEAHLPKVRWPGIRLRTLEIDAANLNGANLCDARLRQVTARKANFHKANLHGARLIEFSAPLASMVGADLSYVRATGADFQGADLSHASLEGALLRAAHVEGARLRGANCRRADFADALFSHPQLDLTDADFAGANLSGSLLDGAVLRVGNFVGAQFSGAKLRKCDLEGMRLPSADFSRADLSGARLTGSYIPAARFRGAILAETGLAEIEWERADLRGADLRGSTFHLGSSRSGLVGSPIACEGSRTGFYTDEINEQDFKAPDEIRKANLRGADLRGAMIDGVDFYLVDLRNALYTSEQEEILRATGAILETRA